MLNIDEPLASIVMKRVLSPEIQECRSVEYRVMSSLSKSFFGASVRSKRRSMPPSGSSRSATFVLCIPSK